MYFFLPQSNGTIISDHSKIRSIYSTIQYRKKIILDKKDIVRYHVYVPISFIVFFLKRINSTESNGVQSDARTVCGSGCRIQSRDDRLVCGMMVDSLARGNKSYEGRRAAKPEKSVSCTNNKGNITSREQLKSMKMNECGSAAASRKPGFCPPIVLVRIRHAMDL